MTKTDAKGLLLIIVLGIAYLSMTWIAIDKCNALTALKAEAIKRGYACEDINMSTGEKIFIWKQPNENNRNNYP